MLNKKQIVFIEPKATVNTYRIARTLKLTGKYETALFCFSKVDKSFFEKAYDKIFILEISHKLRIKNLINFAQKSLSKTGKRFFKKMERTNPHIFQITGPDLFSLMAILFLKKDATKIYYANDLWGADKRNFFFTKKYWVKGEFQKLCEKISFKMIDGVINKHAYKQFTLLNYDVPTPKMSLPPICLDEWTIPPKKKKNKEIHIAYGGSPFPSWGKNISFLEIVKIITSQKIYLHSYGPCTDGKDNPILIKESEKNKYYKFHERVNPNNLNKELSKYDYGIFPEFWEPSEVDSNPGIVKTGMGTKMTNYIEAGLPIIISKQDEYMAKIVEKYNIGFSIDFGDLKNLRKIIEQKDYRQLQKNVKKFQEEFKWSKKIKDIEKFYEKVIKTKSEAP